MVLYQILRLCQAFYFAVLPIVTEKAVKNAAAGMTDEISAANISAKRRKTQLFFITGGPGGACRPLSTLTISPAASRPAQPGTKDTLPGVALRPNCAQSGSGLRGSSGENTALREEMPRFLSSARMTRARGQ